MDPDNFPCDHRWEPGTYGYSCLECGAYHPYGTPGGAPVGEIVEPREEASDGRP